MNLSFLFGIGLIVSAYLLGGVPFGLVISKKLWGVDPRAGGSGGIGFTNVMRTVNKKAAFLTLLLDTLKGTLPVTVSRLAGLSTGWISAIALTAILGHIFSPYLKFKGGKGIATGFGVVLGISPVAFLAIFFLWNAVYFIWKYSSLAGLISFSFLPLVFWFSGGR
ncbi:MAG TPA: glycerol-3-phosphate 1-O-acyltransferase PlsY, partial [Nitrospiria bacterium]|nr:glycerol-3-phosphate 1-O-acyltransferase PlsY [Nitrospiria bacterium]